MLDVCAVISNNTAVTTPCLRDFDAAWPHLPTYHPCLCVPFFTRMQSVISTINSRLSRVGEILSFRHCSMHGLYKFYSNRVVIKEAF